MTGVAITSGPSYISSHSADVILSDIRPIKLNIEALKSINVLLDEFLYSILSTASSLNTDKLRASLLSLLPTNLGKEALLEAEVELRAYWERTRPANGRVQSVDDDSKTFSLQWSFELLRLKCSAFSTLNESDEDPGAESRVYERMTQAGGASPPTATLVAPASLYLTAILEAMCEHILSNVGRVASRDSSRTSATVQDLFVALCEDDSIYGLFKTMKVYEQIEQLSKTPKPRRSKSFSRTDKLSLSRTSSPHQDLSTIRDPSLASLPRSRLSSEASTMATMVGAAPTSTSGSRSSFDKARTIKMFMTNNRGSNDRDTDSLNGHKRSSSLHNSVVNDDLANGSEGPEDEFMLAEFDDLMRSETTMKVSLTPDRLKTMEVYKQEKDQRGNRRPTPLSFKPEIDSSVIQPRTNGRSQPSSRHVDSIIEDEEEGSSPKPTLAARIRQTSISSPSSSSKSSPSNRTRSVSNPSRSAGPRGLIRKNSRNAALPLPVSSSPTTPATAPTAPPAPSGASAAKMQTRDRGFPKMHGGGDPGFPQKTRRIQHNRESLDLDEIMAGSDDENEIEIPARPKMEAKPPQTPGRGGKAGVSNDTRDLMDFLAQGPPDDSMSQGGRDMNDFLLRGPPNYNPSTISVDTKPKGAGRLQRMISKLNLGNPDKSRSGGSEDFSRSTSSRPPPTTPRSLPSKSSATNLSALANRPIPPRPPLVSPLSSSSHSSAEDSYPIVPPRNSSMSQRSPIEQKFNGVHTLSPPAVPAKAEGKENNIGRQIVPTSTANGYARNGRAEPPKLEAVRSLKTVVPDEEPSQMPSTAEPQPTKLTPYTPTRKPVPSLLAPVSTPHISLDDTRDLHRMLSKAQNADECRLIFDMFLAKSGIPVQPTDYNVPYPSPSPSHSSTARQEPTPADAALENSLVELFLGSEVSQDVVPRKRRARKFKTELAVAAASAATADSRPPSHNGIPIPVESPRVTPAHTPVRELEA